MIHLHVWLRPTTGAPVRVGEILVADPDAGGGGRLRGEFRYAAEYLRWPDAFPIDPFHLPLGLEPMAAERPQAGIHGVFEDSLPDAWGRAIMCRRHRLPRSRQRPADLLALLGPEAMGALAHTASTRWEDEAGAAELPDLVDLAAAAERYQREPDAPMDEMMQLFRAGSSPGGARPKVLVRGHETAWLAKFPAVRDEFDMVRLEAATLATAVQAGILVPEFSVLELGSRAALLVKRFDVTTGQGRNHVLSMQTLLGAENYYYLGYSDLADVVRRLSDRPGEDLRGLFRQCVFNAMIGNTDDHLKNFAMLRGAGGWRLTPAYDLLPDVNGNREHVLHFGPVGTKPTLDSLHWLGRVFGLSPGVTRTIAAEVMVAARGFASQCEAFGVPPGDVEIVRGRMPLLTK